MSPFKVTTEGSSASHAPDAHAGLEAATLPFEPPLGLQAF